MALFNDLNNRTQKSREFVQTSIKVSSRDFVYGVGEFLKRPSPHQGLKIVKESIGSSAWVVNSYINLFKTIAGKSRATGLQVNDEDSRVIIDKISKNIKLEDSKFSQKQIFQAIYNELYYSYQNPQYETKLKTPKIFPTIVLVSGMLNEVYATAAFERGVQHLQKSSGLRYIVAQTHGFKSSKHNTEQIKEQLFDYVEQNPDEKLWIIAYSKGGIDSLHFLKDNKDWAEKNIVGLSTLATPILGSQHLNHKILQLINKLHSLESTHVYKYLNKHIDILAREFQESIDIKHQKPWFLQNYHLLPNSVFYTALALESEWYESHIYMILAKLIFKSESVNDGVVDAESALFPDYFPSLNLGIIKGHHLIGARSSSYSQEALINAHIIFLKYMNLV